jgi:hypothetical protein
MALQLVGYQLIDTNNNNQVLQSWGGTIGQCPSIPTKLDIPFRQIQVFNPSVGDTYEGLEFIGWYMDDGT